MSFAARAKRFVNFWNLAIFLVGIALMGNTGYVLLLDKDHVALPSFFYYGAAISGAALSITAYVGFQGLRQHRRMVTEGKRNGMLISYMFLAMIASGIVVLTGFIALTMHGVISDAEAKQYSITRVKYLEQAVIEKLGDLVENNPEEWISVQDSMLCCGYSNATYFDQFLKDDYTDKVAKLNQESGGSCTKTVSWCGGEEHIPCPRKGKLWCRTAFLDTANRNSSLIGSVSLMLAIAQLVAFVLSLYILLCDSRVLNDPGKVPRNKV